MTEYNNFPFIVGGFGFEVEHFNGDSWDQKQNLPGEIGGGAIEFIELHSLVNFRDAVYLFGGR